jgi:hypothetical protein
MLPAVPVLEPLLPSPMATGAMPAGPVPVITVAAPHRALEGEQRQEDQREEQEEREEPEAVATDVPHDLDGLAALVEPVAHAPVVRADPDAYQQQDHQDRGAHSEPASHLEPPCRMGPSHPWHQTRAAV